MADWVDDPRCYQGSLNGSAHDGYVMHCIYERGHFTATTPWLRPAGPEDTSEDRRRSEYVTDETCQVIKELQEEGALLNELSALLSRNRLECLAAEGRIHPIRRSKKYRARR